MDNLEKFVQKNRSEFDDLKPNETIWEGIESQLPAPKKTFLHIWKAAAVIFMITTLGFFLYLVASNQSSDYELSTEFKDAESYYALTIAEKKKELHAISWEDHEEASLFNNQLDMLDDAYSNLKKEYRKTGEDQVYQALIYNLQLRVEILQKQLNLLQKLKEDENEDISTAI